MGERVFIRDEKVHALDSSQELEIDIIKKEMKQMKIAPFEEIIEQ